MTQGPAAISKIPPESPQPTPRRAARRTTQEKLAAKLEKVKIRPEADAPNMRKPGAALVAHYLDPTAPVQARWCARRRTPSAGCASCT